MASDPFLNESHWLKLFTESRPWWQRFKLIVGGCQFNFMMANRASICGTYDLLHILVELHKFSTGLVVRLSWNNLSSTKSTLKPILWEAKHILLKFWDAWLWLNLDVYDLALRHQDFLFFLLLNLLPQLFFRHQVMALSFWAFCVSIFILWVRRLHVISQISLKLNLLVVILVNVAASEITWRLFLRKAPSERVLPFVRHSVPCTGYISSTSIGYLHIFFSCVVSPLVNLPALVLVFASNAVVVPGICWRDIIVPIWHVTWRHWRLV